ncbi:unnamed protein product [Dovyalis caffra]|uniref:Uncharacterized protein n=1 Tax=Dovyalis caffra TaxID=77055 RepID=A0AAV1QNL9_9ROSI|nr:unnamed protein product [Dovyalis caffra]
MEVNKELAEPYLSSSLPIPSITTRWWSKDTVAIVTGANKGIGFSLVKQLTELGLTVILTARDVEKGNKAVELLKSHGLLVHFYRLDVSDPASIKTFTSWFQRKFGVLDILVNNAAVSFNDIYENSVEHAETVIKTNFYGAKLLTEAVLPMFRRSDSISRILNISSRLGSINKMRNPKIKEMLLSEKLSAQQIEGMANLVLAKQYEGSGLSVNCFCPGFTQTSMTGGKGTHTADDAAQVGVRLTLLPPEELSTGKFYIGFNTVTSSKL